MVAITIPVLIVFGTQEIQPGRPAFQSHPWLCSDFEASLG